MPPPSIVESSELQDALAEHARRFRERHPGSADPRLFFSPGRVNLMGAHLDYNGGPVMPTSIDRGTFLALAPRCDRRFVLASTLERETVELELDRLPERAHGSWSDYPVGVLRHIVQSVAPASGLDVLFGGNLPIGAGLSSSASICVGTALALRRVWGLGGTMQDCIESALWGERQFVGVQCGIMDPYAVGHTRPGHLLWLDCKDASIEHLPLDSTRVVIAVADSGVRRSLAQGAFNLRVDQCRRAFELLEPFAPTASCLRDVPRALVESHAALLGPELLRRARHVTSEVERTFAARAALLRADLAEVGSLISATHVSLREDYEVSVPELDRLVELAWSWPGTWGARLTGAGFGGCVVVLLRPEACDGFDEHMARAFESRFGRRPWIGFFRGDRGPREVELD
jgi:galactokinase